MKSILTLLALAGAITLGSCAGDARSTSEARATEKVESATDAKAVAATETGDTRSSDIKASDAKTMNADDPNVMVIKVTSMQCAMCAKTIKRAVRAFDVTEEVKVDIRNKTVYVRVDENTPAVRTKLETAISQAGYTTENIPAVPAAYEQLEKCCKIGGMGS
jgi:copper chaperone CopZ